MVTTCLGAVAMVLIAGSSSRATEVRPPPVANDQFVATLENSPVAITLSASDPDGDELRYFITRPPGRGQLSRIEPNLVYTPEVGFVGTDSFGWRAGDGTELSNEAVVTISVADVTGPGSSVSTGGCSCAASAEAGSSNAMVLLALVALRRSSGATAPTKHGDQE